MIRFHGHGGVTLAADEAGPSDGPSVIFLHGGGQTRHSWGTALDAASARGLHAITVDLRGHGDSDWAPDGDYSSQSFVADLERFCEAIGFDKFTLIGHSMGGRNSMAFAGSNAQKLEKLVIVDIGPDLDPKGSGRITQELIDVPEEFDSFEDLYTHQSKQNKFCSEPVLRRRLTYASKKLPDGKYGWRYDLEIREQRRNNAGPKQPDLWANLPGIECPVLIVRGSETDTLALETAEKMLEALPNGRLIHVDKAAHMVFEDNPADFIEALHGFLD